MKKKIFIYFVPIVIIILSVSFLILFNHKNNNINKTTENNTVKKNIDDNLEKQQSSEKIEEDKNNESIKMQQSDDEIKEENNSANSNTINTNSQNINNSNNNISTNTNIQTKVETKTLTEWEKLGISEWDYYHTPAPNEGELATGITDCDNEANNIISKYKLVAHSGDTYSYSDDYLGCWIVIVFSDNSRIFYNEFKNREKTGEFNYLLRNTN